MNKIFKGKFGPLLIAEIGGNHEGNFEYAEKLTQLAIDTQVDFVKFQIYYGDTLVSPRESPERNKHFKNFELSKEQHLRLASMVRDAGIGYTASVWDFSSIDWIDPYMNIYKIGSGDLTAYPLIRKIAQTGKPMILSTGLSTEDEVMKTVEYIRTINPEYNKPEKLAILQCTSMYPIADGDAHLNVMNRLRELTGATVGYSDHTEGIDALTYATAMGAEVLEFHFTDNRSDKIFRDHKISLMPHEVQELIENIKRIKKFQGDFIKKPLQIEMDNGYDVSFRRAVYPLRDIDKGETLTPDNLTILRPNHGIDAREYDLLIGKRLKVSIKKHKKLSWSFIEV